MFKLPFGYKFSNATKRHADAIIFCLIDKQSDSKRKETILKYYKQQKYKSTNQA